MNNFVWLFVFVLDTVQLATGNVYYATAGKKVILDCGVNSYTESVSWYTGKDQLYSAEKRGMGVPRKGQNELVLRSRIMQETKLEISKVKEEDAGLFSCRADGTNYEHTLLVVSVSASPSSELELHNKVQLHCEVKGFKQDPKVEWRSPDGSVKDPTFNIDSVTPAHSGNWVCDITYDGKHHKETLIIKVKEPAPATTTSSPTKNSKSPACPTCATPSKVSWWVWVAVGVGGFVMILLMVCVIVLCKRIKRRKKKMQRMKKGRLGSKQYCQCNSMPAAARPQQGRRKEKPSALPLQPRLKE
ncbi:protein turtle-like [Channa argus]|uniref:protein turtle-like n=1 Tax=Channa argus TaxID=215402 RepID=UPI003521E07D